MKILVKIIVVLIFTLAGVLFFHSLASVNGDIGRHIKLGEIIWQSGEVPKINLLSFTAPDYSFVNHHWLSEVIFYGVYYLGSDPVKLSSDNYGASWITGLKSIMIFKIIILLGTYLLLFLTVRRYNILSIVLAFLVSIAVFSARTDPRPEIFSYLIFAAYLLIIYRTRTTMGTFADAKVPIVVALWLLPIFQLLWVNLHIYFIIGPVIYLFYLVERAVLKKINKQDILVGLAIVLASFINPNFIAGALYPFSVLSNYGYNVVENSSLFFLAKYFGHWAPQDKLFLISLFILGCSFVLNFWKVRLINIKTRIFDLLLVAMTIFLSFKMQRSIPFYALSLWPIMSENLDSIFKFKDMQSKGIQRAPLYYKGALCIPALILIVSIYFVVSGKFYSWLNAPRTFGLEVSGAAQDGTDFIKINKIQGPVFNNFDIGSYLAWQLYPDQKVFVDGRPEAYPASFFKDIYKPMQSEAGIWKQKADEYKINYVFFAHTDMTEWANEFLIRINKDKEWSMVFLNDAVVVFLKNNDANGPVINDYKITEENINERASSVTAKLNKNDDNAFVNFGNVLYRFGWFEASAKVYETLIVNRPDKPYSYQGAGYAYVAMNEPATQEKARQNLKKAIDLGFESFNNYFTLGIINANLGNFTEAEENIKKALKINPDNQSAKQALEVIKKK